jgi:hypothetical protein
VRVSPTWQPEHGIELRRCDSRRPGTPSAPAGTPGASRGLDLVVQVGVDRGQLRLAERYQTDRAEELCRLRERLLIQRVLEGVDVRVPVQSLLQTLHREAADEAVPPDGTAVDGAWIGTEERGSAREHRACVPARGVAFFPRGCIWNAETLVRLVDQGFEPFSECVAFAVAVAGL